MKHPILRDNISLHKGQSIDPFMSIIAICNFDRCSGETLVCHPRVQIRAVSREATDNMFLHIQLTLLVLRINWSEYCACGGGVEEVLELGFDNSRIKVVRTSIFLDRRRERGRKCEKAIVVSSVPFILTPSTMVTYPVTPKITPLSNENGPHV